MFGVQQSVFNVSEDTPVGTVITSVTATDQDDGEFGTVVFSLESQDHDFAIDSSVSLLPNIYQVFRNLFMFTFLLSQKRVKTYNIVYISLSVSSVRQFLEFEIIFTEIKS